MSRTLQAFRPWRMSAVWQLDSSDDWMRDAACADQPAFNVGIPHAKDIRQAKAICASCPVQSHCLEFALEGGEQGVWGGTTDVERQRLKRASA